MGFRVPTENYMTGSTMVGWRIRKEIWKMINVNGLKNMGQACDLEKD